MSVDSFWNPQIAPWIIAPLFGFGIGYLTNALAVRMLFRPHRPIRIGPFTLQGMIPKRQAQIAAAVAHTIATELLHEKSLSERVADENFRDAAAEMTERIVQSPARRSTSVPSDAGSRWSSQVRGAGAWVTGPRE